MPTWFVERSMSHVVSLLKHDSKENNISEFKHETIFPSSSMVQCFPSPLCFWCTCCVQSSGQIATPIYLMFEPLNLPIQRTTFNGKERSSMGLSIPCSSPRRQYNFWSSKGDAGHPAGLEVGKHDAGWVRRFGKIRFVWAG